MGDIKNDELKSLLVKLSHAINDFRLSSYNGSIPKQQLSENEMSMLVNALPLSEYLPDGRVIDSATGQVDYQNESSVYLIKKMDGEELLVKSLKEAADILGWRGGCCCIDYLWGAQWKTRKAYLVV